jgi:hypothetical protein
MVTAMETSNIRIEYTLERTQNRQFFMSYLAKLLYYLPTYLTN